MTGLLLWELRKHTTVMYLKTGRLLSQKITQRFHALSMSGGMEYALNTSIGRAQPLSLSFSVDCVQDDWKLTLDKKKE